MKSSCNILTLSPAILFALITVCLSGTEQATCTLSPPRETIELPVANWNRIDIDRYKTETSYRAEIVNSLSVLDIDPTDKCGVNRLNQLLLSEVLTLREKSEFTLTAAKYKVCSVAPALIELLGEQPALFLEPEFGKMGADEALISLGECAYPYLREYLIEGDNSRIHYTIAQIMWHFIGSDQALLDVLKRIRKDAMDRHRSLGLKALIVQIKNRQHKNDNP